MVNQHFASDASNHVSGPPYEDVSNVSYLGLQTMYPDQTQLQVANNMSGMDAQMNTCTLILSLEMYLLFHHYIR
jgi:hypothetical protein